MADTFWVVKGVSNEREVGVTNEKPVFADNERGARAALFDKMIKAKLSGERAFE